jgi:ABC-type lipoprotein export system ATPase subunit
MLKLLNVSKSFSNSERENEIVVEKVSFELKAGEMGLVTAPAKTGKTTLMLMAGGLLEPDSGMVDFITQPDIYSLPPGQLAYFRNREIGYLFHKFHLIQRLNVYDNIMIPELGEKAPGASERAETLLRKLDIVRHRNLFPQELSLLDRQKTAMARAMLHLPRLLLADEPTENLDQEGETAIFAALREYADEGNCVVVFSRLENIPVSTEKTIKLTPAAS